MNVSLSRCLFLPQCHLVCVCSNVIYVSLYLIVKLYIDYVKWFTEITHTNVSCSAYKRPMQILKRLNIHQYQHCIRNTTISSNNNNDEWSTDKMLDLNNVNIEWTLKYSAYHSHNRLTKINTKTHISKWIWWTNHVAWKVNLVCRKRYTDSVNLLPSDVFSSRQILMSSSNFINWIL